MSPIFTTQVGHYEPVGLRLQLVTVIYIAMCLVLYSCGTATVSSRNELDTTTVVAPTIIYVSDFDLDAEKIRSERSMLLPPPKLPGPLSTILPPLPGASKDPKVRARDLVDLMSNSLVEDLAEAGFNAHRLPAASPLPTSGWWVRGLFIEVNQGNQLRRAVIGFGMGKTDLQVVVDINDLAQGTPKRFYQLNTTADSGKAPGAGPLILLGPVGVAARFVIAGDDLERNVKETAKKIAADVIERTKAVRTAK